VNLHFFSLDEKKRSKEKSSQNNASTALGLRTPAILAGQRSYILMG
jgi:hypothetical protein